MDKANRQQTSSKVWQRRSWVLFGILGGILGLGTLGVVGFIALCPTCIGWLSPSSAVSSAQNPDSAELPIGTDVGNQAPDFALMDIDGNRFSLSDLRGRPVILYFSATWCLPCIPETQELAKRKARYDNIEIVWISVDPSTDTSERLRVHRRKYARDDFIYALDTNGIARQYRVVSLGDLYLLDARGRIIFKGTRPVGKQPFEETLKRVVSE